MGELWLAAGELWVRPRFAKELRDSLSLAETRSACVQVLKAGDQTQVQPAEAHAGPHPMPASSPGSKPGTSQSTRSAAGMNIVAARYILDFGYVIKGASKASKHALLAQLLQKHVALHNLKRWLPARLAASVQ